MIVSKDMQILPRQYGKTTELKLKAIKLNQQYYKVYFISFSERSSRELERYFKNINTNIQCVTLRNFNIRSVQNNEVLLPEWLLVNTGEIYILLDEFTIMDQTEIQSFTNDLTMSKHKFCIIGRSS